MALDELYAPAEELGVKGIRFHALPAPETAEVAELLAVVSRRIFRVLVRSGRLREEEDGYTWSRAKRLRASGRGRRSSRAKWRRWEVG